MEKRQQKPDVVRARVWQEERRALEAIAVYERRTLSETLREATREAAKARGLWPPSERAEEVERDD